MNGERVPLKNVSPCGFICSTPLAGNDVMLTKVSPLAAPEIGKITIRGVDSDENFIKMTFPFQCLNQHTRLLLLLNEIT